MGKGSTFYTVNFQENSQANFSCPSGKNMTIIVGTYGSSDCNSDVTNYVNKQKSNNQVNFIVSNDNMGGDSCPGSIKTLKVIYKCD